VALAADGGEIEVWGDGQQTRSYCYIDDCVEGIYRLMQSKHRAPLNLGTDRLVSINELVDMVAELAGKTIRKRYNLSAPQGVRGRNSDNTQLREVLGWEPGTTLEAGLAVTYRWIRSEMTKQPQTYQLDGGKTAGRRADLSFVAVPSEASEEMSAAD
jgi:nucleoside-diphosphate-sugar epimerase